MSTQSPSERSNSPMARNAKKPTICKTIRAVGRVVTWALLATQLATADTSQKAQKHVHELWAHRVTNITGTHGNLLVDTSNNKPVSLKIPGMPNRTITHVQLPIMPTEPHAWMARVILDDNTAVVIDQKTLQPVKTSDGHIINDIERTTFGSWDITLTSATIWSETYLLDATAINQWKPLSYFYLTPNKTRICALEYWVRSVVAVTEKGDKIPLNLKTLQPLDKQ